MAIVQPKQRFVVSLYADGKHSEPVKTVAVTTNLIELLGQIYEWRGMEKICCWDATNNLGEIVAGKGCTYDGD